MDLSGTAEGTRLANTLDPLARQAKRGGIPWLLIGAEARDLVLMRYGSHPSVRRTLDVDIAVQLASWTDFEQLRTRLVQDEDAQFDRANAHRLTLPAGAKIDIVPFGPIAPDGELIWPAPESKMFDVHGLIEAQACAFEVRLSPDLCVRVPELELQICLKLFAWRDRHAERPDHDSTDIKNLLRCIDLAITDEEVYVDYAEQLDHNDYDPELTKLEVCGARLSRQLSEATRQALIAVLQRETDMDGKLGLMRELRDLHRPDAWLRSFLRGVTQSAT